MSTATGRVWDRVTSGEVGELHLDGDRPPGQLGRPGDGRPPTRTSAAAWRCSVGRVVEVVAEGLLVADRLGRPVRHHRARVVRPGQGGQMARRGPGRAGGPRRRLGQRGQLADRPDARGRAAARRWPGRRPTAPPPAAGAGRPARRRAATTHHARAPGRLPSRSAVGLAARDASLATSLERPMPTEQSSDSSSRTRLADARGRWRRAARAAGGAPVTSRKASSSPIGSTSGVTDSRIVAQLPAHLGVAGVVTVDEDRVRAELPGPQRRHGRAHAEGPGLVGARGHHAAGAAARRR